MKRITTSQFTRSPAGYIHQCNHEPIEITKHGRTVAFMVSPQAVNLSTNFSVNNISTGGQDEKTYDHS